MGEIDINWQKLVEEFWRQGLAWTPRQIAEETNLPQIALFWLSLPSGASGEGEPWRPGKEISQAEAMQTIWKRHRREGRMSDAKWAELVKAGKVKDECAG